MAKLIVPVLIVLILIAHVFLWRSEMAFEQKLTFTILNAVAWTIVLAPILLIDRWLEAIQRRNKENRDAQNPDH